MSKTGFKRNCFYFLAAVWYESASVAIAFFLNSALFEMSNFV